MNRERERSPKSSRHCDKWFYSIYSGGKSKSSLLFWRVPRRLPHEKKKEKEKKTKDMNRILMIND